MKIIVATDSYKGTISASDATGIIASELAKELPFAQIIKMPVADGGEGSTECFVEACGGGYVVTTVKNCYFEDTTVKIGLIDDGKTAVIEVAAAAGLAFANGRRNPMLTTTYGVGQMIQVAAGLGVRRIILCLGGSATNDLGCGAAAALGVRFLDGDGEEMLPLGGTLDEVASLDASGVPDALRAIEFICLCDIKGTLTGDHGAAKMFSPQKGATPEMADILENGAMHIGKLIDRDLGINVFDIEGGGAAGGFGAGAVAFFDAEIRSGIEEILRVVGFENALEDCTAVVTGEGRVDAQSSDGKALCGIIAAAKRKSIPVIVIAGSLASTENLGADAVFSTVTDFCTFNDVAAKAKENLRACAKNIAIAVSIGAGRINGR